MADCPQQFAAWSHRIALADSLRHAGRLTDADLDGCDRQLGIPGSRIAKGVDSISINTMIGADPLLALSTAIAAFLQGDGGTHAP